MPRVSSAIIASALVPDSQDRNPMHQQIYERVRELILLGRLQPGQALPSTRTLAADLGVSRNTVLHAFEQLRTEGYLEGIVGSRTAVASQLPEQMVRPARIAPPSNNFADPSPTLSDYAKRIIGQNSLAAKPVPYRPFQAGFPAFDKFPFELWAKLAEKYRRTAPHELYGYSNAAGYLPLRKALASYLMLARGVRCSPEQIIIVSGAQQGLHLTASLLLNPGDSVWLEEPGYFGARAAFEAVSARIVPVPVTPDGIDLFEGMKQAKNARLAYTTPSHQFPLGVTMSMQRRLELLDWAAASSSWIIEDDYDGEFRYTSRPLPALQSIDSHESVIYLGTFSKILFPALRLGYLIVPPRLVDAFTIAKRVSDYHSPLLEQAIITDFITEGHLSRHVRRMRTLYRERLDFFIDTARTEWGEAVELKNTDAGMHVLTVFPNHVDDIRFAEEAESRGVSTMALSPLYAGSTKTPGLMLGFAGFGPRQTKSGIRTLSALFRSSFRSQ